MSTMSTNNKESSSIPVDSNSKMHSNSNRSSPQSDIQELNSDKSSGSSRLEPENCSPDLTSGEIKPPCSDRTSDVINHIKSSKINYTNPTITTDKNGSKNCGSNNATITDNNSDGSLLLTSNAPAPNSLVSSKHDTSIDDVVPPPAQLSAMSTSPPQHEDRMDSVVSFKSQTDTEEVNPQTETDGLTCIASNITSNGSDETTTTMHIEMGSVKRVDCKQSCHNKSPDSLVDCAQSKDKEEKLDKTALVYSREQCSQTQQEQCQKECQTDSAQCQKECQTEGDHEGGDVSDYKRKVVCDTQSMAIKCPTDTNKDQCLKKFCQETETDRTRIKAGVQRSSSIDHCHRRFSERDPRYQHQRRQQSTDYLYFCKKSEAGGVEVNGAVESGGGICTENNIPTQQSQHQGSSPPNYFQLGSRGGGGPLVPLSSSDSSSIKGHHKRAESQFSDPGCYDVEFHSSDSKYTAVEVVTTEVLVVSSSTGGLLQDAPMTVPSSPPDETPASKTKWGFSSGIGKPSLYHALVVIFLEFFAWGLLTSPMIDVLNDTFPDHTFLMNGLIMGIKGILSFLSAPLIGALSDVWGRKFFLLVTVFFTCLPIPFMKINTWWYFALISMSGVFAVTFSIVFAYVADVTDEEERSYAYGLVSATFAASLVTSPALGAYLGSVHSDDLVVGLATAIALLDVFFILVAVPESLPEKLRLSSSWSAANITWENADPFSALWKVSSDRRILLISMTVLLSYLPEAGQYSCFFVYLRLVMGFNAEMVATFIAAVGILSVVAQTALLALLMKNLSCKKVIIIGLMFEMMQLMWYGFGSQAWIMWAAGLLASISSITYPAISSYVSMYTDADKQGVVQGIVTGVRGLCAGLGPAMFGFIFYIFHVDLSESSEERLLNANNPHNSNTTTVTRESVVAPLVPGPPFVFGSLMVMVALLVAVFLPEGDGKTVTAKTRRQSGSSTLDMGYERSHKKNDSIDAASLPLMDESVVL
uniref:Hippocampus abundant transcript 1 protein n=1 Tax=Hirondellea gigas TaxID=1518452 RepID=A0A6A7G087_9CRUS